MRTLISLLLLSAACRLSAVTFVSDGTSADVQAKCNMCNPGDIVTMPAGTFSWTAGIAIADDVILIGSTTVNPVAKTANDQTIILDDLTTDAPAISLIPNAGRVARVSGITFQPGSRGTAQYQSGIINIAGSTQTNGVRIDNCHFIGMFRGDQITWLGSVYGVVDHCLFDFSPTSAFAQSFLVRMGNWGNNPNGAGDGSFADYPWFGTGKFVFFEDNCFNNTSTSEIEGTSDGDFGGRLVFRYNHCYNVQLAAHGSEGRYRGWRCSEVYNNDFHWSFSPSSPGGLRSGVGIYHDNTFDGSTIDTTSLTLSSYRCFFTYYWGGGNNNFPWGASGDNVWDVNATEADGTHVDGHSPYLFASGSVIAGAGTFVNGGALTSGFTDSGSPGWTVNQWVGYTAKRVSDNKIMAITANTANTVTGYYRQEQGGGADWTAGNQYEIHKVLISMDQPGRGKCDLLTGGWDSGGATINSVTGTAAWPHQALEPCYSWNNKYTPNNSDYMGFSAYTGCPIIEGRDFFSGSSSGAMAATYTSSLNGADYTGPYTYPHPLQGGTSARTASPLPVSVGFLRGVR